MTIAIITEQGVRKVAPLVLSAAASAALAQQANVLAQQAAGIAAAVASERYYDSYSAGNAATTTGQYFAVLGSGVYNFHLHGSATPVVMLPALDAAGNLGLGITPTEKLHVAGNILLAQGVDRIVRIGSESNYHYDLRTRLDDFRIVAADGTIVLNVLYPTYSVNPGTDGVASLGAALARWSTVYATTGTINTSDADEKTWRSSPTEAELRAAKRIIAELGFYQWNDAIAEKGAEGARYHFGIRAQQVWAIMADEELIDPLDDEVTPNCKYAFLCWDEWDEIEPVEAVEEERDEDDNIIVHAQPAQPGREAGSRFGVRSDQLTMFLISAQESRLAALEAAL